MFIASVNAKVVKRLKGLHPPQLFFPWKDLTYEGIRNVELKSQASLGKHFTSQQNVLTISKF